MYSAVGIENRTSEVSVKNYYIKKGLDEPLKHMLVEDLAALDHLTEETILKELEARMKSGQFHTFIGDILLVLNPNESQNIYGIEVSKGLSFSGH